MHPQWGRSARAVASVCPTAIRICIKSAAPQFALAFGVAALLGALGAILVNVLGTLALLALFYAPALGPILGKLVTRLTKGKRGPLLAAATGAGIARRRAGFGRAHRRDFQPVFCGLWSLSPSAACGCFCGRAVPAQKTSNSFYFLPMIPLKILPGAKATPYFTWIIVALNVAVFGVQVWLNWRVSFDLAAGLGEVPRCLFAPTACGIAGELATRANWFSPFYALFLHADLLHLGFNMLFLLVFGGALESELGRVRWLLCYFYGGSGGDVVPRGFFAHFAGAGYRRVGRDCGFVGRISGAFAQNVDFDLSAADLVFSSARAVVSHHLAGRANVGIVERFNFGQRLGQRLASRGWRIWAASLSARSTAGARANRRKARRKLRPSRFETKSSVALGALQTHEQRGQGAEKQ